MKIKFWLTGLMAVVLTGAAWMAFADNEKKAPAGDDGPGAMDDHGGDQDGMGGGMVGGDMMGGHANMLKEKLGLSDGQVTQLKDLFKKQMEGNRPLRDQMKIDMDTLRQKVDLKASNGDIKKLLDKLDGERKEMEASREKMKDQIRAILDPTQQAKMVLGMREKGMQMMGKWMKHRKGGMNKKGGHASGAKDGDQDSDAGK